MIINNNFLSTVLVLFFTTLLLGCSEEQISQSGNYSASTFITEDKLIGVTISSTVGGKVLAKFVSNSSPIHKYHIEWAANDNLYLFASDSGVWRYCKIGESWKLYDVSPVITSIKGKAKDGSYLEYYSVRYRFSKCHTFAEVTYVNDEQQGELTYYYPSGIVYKKEVVPRGYLENLRKHASKEEKDWWLKKIWLEMLKNENKKESKIFDDD